MKTRILEVFPPRVPQKWISQEFLHFAYASIHTKRSLWERDFLSFSKCSNFCWTISLLV